MNQSRTLDVGVEVHTESIAVASVAQDHHAEVVSLGTIGTRQRDIDHRSRRLQANSAHLIFVYAAGPCGSGRSRDLTPKGPGCWGVAPSVIPHKPGDRVKPNRRDAITRARLLRSGDLTRFDHPRPRMRDLGVIPSDYASGDRRRQGGITQAGHTQARRVLIEGAWVYRYPAQVSRPLQVRLEQLPKPMQELRGNAHVRLCKRDRKLRARGKHATQVVVAIARALIACMWAIAREVPVTA